MKWIISRAIPLLAFGLAASCTRAPAVAPTPAPRTLPNDIRWFRTSAEYRALARQAYTVASDRLPELTRGVPAKTWAVILDADETVLDNSAYQRRRSLMDSVYTPASWAIWVRERAAVAIPGATEFTRFVHALGGVVAIVSNRAEDVCDATRANLRSAGIETDIVICQPPGQADKNPRFERVRSGAASPDGRPLTVVAWVGDNILDFPGMTQAVRDDPKVLAEFGRRYFILPNPMYGSWEQIREP